MDKQASNTFVGGLNTDRHPLTASDKELIEAQNIDLVQVGEGYQLVLQKREGNISVPLGDLPSGFIPLTVKEFNNIAYIVSVNPATDPAEVEIGTFPSPDYDNGFKYIKGDEIPGVTSIGAAIYDPRVDPPDYEFSLTSLGSGADEAVTYVDGTPTTLTNAHFVISNTGILSDTYRLSNSTTPAIAHNVDTYVNGSLFNIATDTITVGPGSTATVTYKQLWVGNYNDSPNVHTAVTVSVTPVESTLAVKTYSFAWHFGVVLGVSTSGGGFTFGNSFSTTERVPHGGGSKVLYWMCNDTAVTTITKGTATFTNPQAGDTVTLAIPSADSLTINFGADPIAVDRNCQFTITATYHVHSPYAGGTVSTDIILIQSGT